MRFKTWLEAAEEPEVEETEAQRKRRLLIMAARRQKELAREEEQQAMDARAEKKINRRDFMQRQLPLYAIGAGATALGVHNALNQDNTQDKQDTPPEEVRLLQRQQKEMEVLKARHQEELQQLRNKLGIR